MLFYTIYFHAIKFDRFRKRVISESYILHCLAWRQQRSIYNTKALSDQSASACVSIYVQFIKPEFYQYLTQFCKMLKEDVSFEDNENQLHTEDLTLCFSHFLHEFPYKYS